MPPSHPFALFALLSAVAACRGGPAVPPRLAEELGQAPPYTEARLWLAGDRVVGATAPLGPGTLPPAVRTTLLAVAPDGETTFTGREWGPRGEGFRIDKAYAEPTHRRSVLIAADGAVLERAHTVPIGDVPADVLAVGAGIAPRLEEAWIVSGPEREEHWTLVMRERAGETIVVQVGLDGVRLRVQRRVAARIDV